MSELRFKVLIFSAALVFLGVLLIHTLPAAIELNDIVAAFLAGFDTPISAGYSTDVISCWFILLFWIIYEKRHYQIKHGWLCALLGIFPGVAVGFSLYLFLRLEQLKKNDHLHAPDSKPS